jgi:hypothetical protein
MKLISVGEAPRPTCGPKEAVVRVKATALNIEDIMTAVGRRPLVSLAATADQPVVLGRGCGHRLNNYEDTPNPKMSSLLLFTRVDRLEIQSVMLVVSTSFVNYCPSNLVSG